MRDIEENPLRTESVKRKEDYGWSSARAHILGMSHDLFPDETRFHEEKVKSKWSHKACYLNWKTSWY
jgi:hypothetical protein